MSFPLKDDTDIFTGSSKDKKQRDKEDFRWMEIDEEEI